MDQLAHLLNNKKNLELKFAILKLMREWFWTQGFTEIESPTIVELPGQEPYLSPMGVKIHNEEGEEFFGYLHTSPEYTMKKMLAAGFDKIFYLGKCFRDYESFGGTHNPEFTMCEWYRTQVDYFKIMEDTESLINYILDKLKNNFQFPISNFQSNPNDKIIKFNKITMKDLWKKYVSVDLDEYLTKGKMFELCKNFDYDPGESEEYEDLFYRIFLNEIEPKLIKPTIVYNYPAQMAALSKLAKADPRYAERFEIYINGLELANAFSELTDSGEQLKRLQEEKTLKEKLGKDVYDVDLEFIEALKNMPESAGIALGVDRLVMLFGGLQNIDNVITLPMSKLFN